MFKEAIDYTTVNVVKGKYLPVQADDTAMTPDGNLYFPEDQYQADFSKLAPATKHWFLHEMVHVWQFQLGFPVRSAGVLLHAEQGRRKLLGLRSVYAYSLEGTAHIESISLGAPSRIWHEFTTMESLNMEQQAQLIADYACRMLNIGFASESALAVKDPSLMLKALERFIRDPSDRTCLPSVAIE